MGLLIIGGHFFLMFCSLCSKDNKAPRFKDEIFANLFNYDNRLSVKMQKDKASDGDDDESDDNIDNDNSIIINDHNNDDNDNV